jgi:hypothetical protein
VRKRAFLLPTVVAALVTLFSLPALAQRPVLRTPPNQFGRPPVYDLLQAPQGILPNYYQYYKPQQDLQRNLRTQDYNLRRQGGAIQSLQNQWRAAEGASGAISPTGRGSVFMNYSHYYSGLR